MEHALAHIASEQGLETAPISDTLHGQLEALLLTPGLIVPTQTSSSRNNDFILANRKRQIAYSLKLSNLLRDQIPTISASGLV